MEATHMTPLTRKLQAAMLALALLLPAGTAVAQVSWSKPDSRTKGTIIGAVAGGLIAGKKGAVIGAVAGNGVQAYRHSHNPHRYATHAAHRRHRHHRRS
jgi:MFS superfamily sulfate permease-like transporter